MGLVIEARQGVVPLNGVEMAIDLLQKRAPVLQPQRRHLTRQAQLGNLKVRCGRITGQEPGIGGAAEEAGVLSGPGDAAGVPDMLGQCQRCRQHAVARPQAFHNRSQAGPVVRCAGLGVFDVGRLVRVTGQHPVAARGMGIVVGGDGAKDADLPHETRGSGH